MSDPNDFNPDDELLGAIDELLDQVEEQRRTREPSEDADALAGAAVDDQGLVVEVATKDTPEPETDTDPASESDAPGPDTDPGQDALDAIDRVESSAQALIEESIDELLGEPDAIEPAETPEPTEPDPEPADEAATESEPVSTPDEAPAPEPAADAAAPPEPKPTDDSPADPLNDAIDALTTPSESGVPAPEAPGSPADGTSAPGTESETETEPEPSDALNDSIDQLDEALADAADEIIDTKDRTQSTELVDEDPESSGSSAAVAAVIQEEPDGSIIEDAADQIDDDLNLDAALDAAVASPSDASETDASPAAPSTQPAPESAPAASEPDAPHTESNPEPEPANEPRTPQRPTIQAPAWFVRFVELVRPRLDKIDPRKGKAVDTLAQGIGWSLGAVQVYAPILAFRAASIISKPLSTQPAPIRAAIGYIGLWTLMLGIVVWFYAVFVRTPTVPEPTEAPTRVLESSPDTAHAAQPDG